MNVRAAVSDYERKFLERMAERRRLHPHPDIKVCDQIAYSYVGPTLEKEHTDIVRLIEEMEVLVKPECHSALQLFGNVEIVNGRPALLSRYGRVFLNSNQIHTPVACHVPTTANSLGDPSRIDEFLHFLWCVYAEEELREATPYVVQKIICEDLSSGRYKQMINALSQENAWMPLYPGKAKSLFTFHQDENKLWTCVASLRIGIFHFCTEAKEPTKATAKEAACKVLISQVEERFPNYKTAGFPFPVTVEWPDAQDTTDQA